MPSDDIFKTSCSKCLKGIGIRPDQFGRRLRCPACRHVFVVERQVEVSSASTQPQSGSDPEPTQTTATVDWLTADEANELVRAAPPREWANAKMTIAFQKSRPQVFQALIQAIRNTQCEIADVDEANFRLRFVLNAPAAQRSEHTVFAFTSANGSCEVDLSSEEPNENGKFDAHYNAIVWEAGKYLMLATDQELTGNPQMKKRGARSKSKGKLKYCHECGSRIRLRAEICPKCGIRQESDDAEPIRSSAKSNGEGFGTTSLVLSLVGIVTAAISFCCSPLVAIAIPLLILGIVFGSLSLKTQRGKPGFILGIVGLVLCVFVGCLTIGLLFMH